MGDYFILCKMLTSHKIFVVNRFRFLNDYLGVLESLNTKCVKDSRTL
jgi:hypothetical protein